MTFEILYRDEAGLVCYARRSQWEEACRVFLGRRRDDMIAMYRDGVKVNPLSWRKYVSKLGRTLGLSSGETKLVMRR